MNNNHILRRVRYIFDLSDEQMLKLALEGGLETTKEQMIAWLKSEDDEVFEGIYDIDLAAILNGFIILKRGRREGPQPKPEKTLSNNLIIRKLKIALEMKNEDIIHVLGLADFKVSPHEVSALFRKPGQRQFRLCKDQFLRNFLMGLQLKYRPKR